MRRRFLIGLMVLLLGAGAFWDGLYAPGQQLAATAAASLLVAFAGGTAPLTTLEAVLLTVFGAAALISLRAPAAAGAAAHGPLIAAGWLLAFWLGRRLADETWVQRTLCWLWAVLGPLMVFGGLAAMSYLPVHHSGRLASFLGYPIAVGALGLLGIAGSLPLLAGGRRWAPFLAWGNGVAILLSGSRGVWAAALVLAVYLAWANRGLIRPLWWPIAGALAAALWIGPAVAARAPLPALLAFLLIGLTVILAGWFPRFSFVAVPAWVVSMAFAAPGWRWLGGRAAALSDGSSIERMTFLKDGLKMAADLPGGAGFKAWTALHLQGASYGYYSAEAHSAPIDLTLAFGWLGGLVFLVLLMRFLVGLRHGRAWDGWRLGALTGLGALALHALVDWDLSYGLFAMPLWLGFGLVSPPGAGRRWPHGAAAALAGLATAGAVVVGAGDAATVLAQRALDAARPDAAARHAALAVALTPWNDLARAQQGRALSALDRTEEAVAAFAVARRYGAFEPWYAELQARELLRAGRPAAAAAAYREFVRLWPWYVPAYEAALSAHIDMLFRADLAGDRATAAEIAASGREILGQLDRQKAKEPAGRPRQPMNLDTPTIRQAKEVFKG
ncbi:MAG TPA: hypothetical protein VD969_06005 [Symbiobacteriaceae bacterium]|nr:hypothetical protein [Symbiobacteriaceae bacterium]